MSDLREWLVSEAGLSGRKLEIALERCSSGEIESIEDLRDLAESPQDFADHFGTGLLIKKLKAALAIQEITPSPHSPMLNSKIAAAANDASDASGKIRAAQELPEGKR